MTHPIMTFSEFCNCEMALQSWCWDYERHYEAGYEAYLLHRLYMIEEGYANI